MEIRTLHLWSLMMILSVALESSFSRDQPTESTGHEAVKPAFTAEPDDSYVLPNSLAPLLCKAKFVSQLKFNCSGGLVPKEAYHGQNEHNVTTLIADVSQAMVKTTALDWVSCVCIAAGHNGVVLRSKTAVVMLAYLNDNFIISPSRDTRIPKNSFVDLRCQPPTGVPRPHVFWEKDDNRVDTSMDGRVEVINQANLSLVLIRKAQTSDVGRYSCVAYNIVGKQMSTTIKLNVYVDGGWSVWREFSPCSAKCGNGTRMLKRFCTNPAPENGGHFCTGPSIKIEPCQEICPDVEIICPNHTNVYVNRSDIAPKLVSWNKPRIINKKNGTKFSLEVIPPWAEPPLKLNASSAVYVITYVVKHEFGDMASCSFNLTIYNISADACSARGCKKHPTTGRPSSPADGKYDGVVLGPYKVAVIILAVFILLMVVLGLLMRNMMLRRKSREMVLHREEYKLDMLKAAPCDSESPLIQLASYSEPAACSVKLRAGSPIIDQEVFDLLPPCKEPSKMVMHVDAEIVNEPKRVVERAYNRTNSSISNKSTVSEISRMMWNISNLPDNADPKMVAWGLVDHNGGKFTIGDTGVSLTVPPLAIPEGRTEGIYIAIMNQEKEHPRVTNEESLLSPVVKCGPNGLKFDRPVILSMPHCALLEEGAWNLKVQYNESEPGTPADWKQLVDVNKQDGSDPYLAVVEANMLYLMVDHFTSFALTGESASSEQAKKKLQIVAYASPPETDGGCVVCRVYCIGDTPVHTEKVHEQETERLRGVTIDAPKPFDFRDGGGDLLVNLTAHHPGWTSTSGDHKKIRFLHIWDGIERLPSCTFMFSLAGESVPQFHATFEVKQNCLDGDEQEVIVSTAIKQRRPRPSENSDLSSKATEKPRTFSASSSLPNSARAPSVEDTTAAVLNAGSFGNSWQSNVVVAPGAGSPAASPLQLKHTSSGYFSFGFESLSTVDSLSRRIRNELILILDPPHPKADWRTLAESVGLETKHIRFFENLKPPAYPTDSLLRLLESQKYPLHELAEKLHEIGREDAAKLIEAQMMLRETEV